MASLASACRLSARVTAQQFRSHGSRRAFHVSPASLAAQNFNMPALSPTMTEGNIATWRVKEGDSFSAGDVLLEIETDKASMDVEAQDDGIMAKIMQGDGSKGVQVGTRIAVTAEPGDDIGSLDIPAEDKPAPKQPESGKQESKQESKPAATESRESAPRSKPASSSTASTGESGGKAQKQSYPLYPSVHQLMKENGLPKEEADKIPATGPNGRLLKGDVLAYIGRVDGSYVSKQSERIHKLAHLDLSNIKLAPPKPAPEKTAATGPSPVPEEPDVEIALPVSLKAVYEVQKRVQDSIGVFLPLSTFIARATELANEDLPRSKATKPSADELFNSVLGLDTITGKTSQGVFTPQVTALPPTSLRATRSTHSKKPDIIDILAGKKSVARSAQTPKSGAVSVVPAINVFSVNVPKGDERRAQLFLERIKVVLEAEPGRLVV